MRDRMKDMRTSLALSSVLLVWGCFVPGKPAEEPYNPLFDVTWEGWNNVGEHPPTVADIQQLELVSDTGGRDEDPCGALNFKLNMKVKGYARAEGTEIDPTIFEVSVAPPLPLDGNSVAYPYSKTLVPFGRPVTVSLKVKGRPDLTRTLQKTFGTDCFQTISASGLGGVSGDDGKDDGSTDGFGYTGRHGADAGAIEAEASWVEVTGDKRHILVVAKVDEKDQYGQPKPTETVIAFVREDDKVTLSAKGGDGGAGGHGAFGGCKRDGGDGGDGGNGGLGGNISLRVSDKALLERIKLEATAGKGGSSGDPGRVDCSSHAAGNRGKSGKNGAKDGAVTTKVVPSSELSLVRKVAATNPKLRVP